MGCCGEDGVKLHLNLRDALKLDLKFLNRTIQLIPQIQEFLHLRRRKVPNRATLSASSRGALRSDRSLRSSRPRGTHRPRRPRRPCGTSRSPVPFRSPRSEVLLPSRRVHRLGHR